MSKTVLSTGRLLVGSTTREKSLTHRLPRGVFARDDEGNIQVADGLTPGGHNPLVPQNLFRLSDRPINVFHLVSGGKLIFFAQNLRNDEYTTLEYTNTLGDIVTLSNPPSSNNYMVQEPMDLEATQVISFKVMAGNGTVIKEITGLKGTLINDYTESQFYGPDRHVHVQALPDEADELNLIPEVTSYGRTMAWLRKNGLIVGIGFTGHHPVAKMTTAMPFTFITWPAVAGRQYYITDLDYFTQDRNVVPVLYSNQDLGDAGLILYDMSGNVITSYDLGAALISPSNPTHDPYMEGSTALVHRSQDNNYLAFYRGGILIRVNLDSFEDAFYSGSAPDLLTTYGFEGGLKAVTSATGSIILVRVCYASGQASTYYVTPSALPSEINPGATTPIAIGLPGGVRHLMTFQGVEVRYGYNYDRGNSMRYEIADYSISGQAVKVAVFEPFGSLLGVEDVTKSMIVDAIELSSDIAISDISLSNLRTQNGLGLVDARATGVSGFGQFDFTVTVMLTPKNAILARPLDVPEMDIVALMLSEKDGGFIFNLNPMIDQFGALVIHDLTTSKIHSMRSVL